MLNSLFGYKYPPPMRKILEEDNSKVQNAVLDLGSGAGNWYLLAVSSSSARELTSIRIIDVARDFPHCEAVAVDLTPMKVMYDLTRLRPETIEESKRIPSNLR